MTVTLGFDVEEFDFPLERGRGIDFGTQLAVSSEGLEFLLDLLARLELRATFYTTANFALHRTDLVRRIVAGGHEVASHDYYHGLTAGSDPAGSRRTLEELTGQRIVGYRAPRLAAASSAALAAAGYRYNSSINPTWIPTRYNNLRAPCSVSREEGLTIYPVSVSAPFRVPLFWISLHVMPLPLYKLLCRSALRRVKRFKCNSVNGYPPRRALRRFALARKLIELFSVDFYCGVHGRYLLNLADKLTQHIAQLFFRHINVKPLQYLSACVLGIGKRAERKLRAVLLVRCRKVIRKFCCFSHTHRQHSRRIGVKRPGMTYLFYSENAPQSVNHIMRSHSCRFVHVDYSVHHSLSAPLNAVSIAATTVFFTSSSCILSENPLAFT